VVPKVETKRTKPVHITVIIGDYAWSRAFRDVKETLHTMFEHKVELEYFFSLL
jgi:hypothetical protein